MGGHHVGHAVGWALGSAAAPLLMGSLFGRRWVWIGVLCAGLATLWLLIWLPRAAHRAFEAGLASRAARRYRLIGMLAFTAKRERAALLSRTACSIALRDFDGASALLESIDPASLDATERAVWLNNRAYILLEYAGAAGDEGRDALALVEEAALLRPDVPGIQHTRAKALLAVGRLDEAITILDAMRGPTELPTSLEAERCKELARLWDRKGHSAYADDYRARARAHAVY